MIVKANENSQTTESKLPAFTLPPGIVTRYPYSSSQTKRPGSRPLEIQRAHSPNNDAMLQALRVVLEMPLKPISLKEAEKP
jgi:hypothetical protein